MSRKFTSALKTLSQLGIVLTLFDLDLRWPDIVAMDALTMRVISDD